MALEPIPHKDFTASSNTQFLTQNNKPKYLTKYFKAALVIILAICVHVIALSSIKNLDWSHSNPEHSDLIEVSIIRSDPRLNPSGNKDIEASAKSIAAEVKQTTRSPLIEPQSRTLTDQASQSLKKEVQPKTLTSSSDENAITQLSESENKTEKETTRIHKSNVPPLSKHGTLLDIDEKHISLAEDQTEGLDIFSPNLRAAISQAEKDQSEYLKGQHSGTEYVITEDGDGTRYVDIHGVCWKIPELGSDEEWVIALEGCNKQKKAFHFELNITTDILSPESPLNGLFSQE
ncbi:hypothetical protein [Marinomonas balearica]|uniref:Uncharacterized protein n=1 Tax=Marinomonas balearica TaxID=491947 RepID=A0A4R6M575_9GAMM|nr:hypothetical protein [Marinomonas balearica]TDO96488.1 hypothetical protein DFP79_3068 [Marinomonas balearica]